MYFRTVQNMPEQLLCTNNQFRNITFLETDSNDNLSWTTRTFQKFTVFWIVLTLSEHFAFLSHCSFSTERIANCKQISKTKKLLSCAWLWKKTNKTCQNPPKTNQPTKSPKQNTTTRKKKTSKHNNQTETTTKPPNQTKPKGIENALMTIHYI